MNYFSLELIDGANILLNFLSEPRFVTLIKNWQKASRDNSKGINGMGATEGFIKTTFDLDFVFKAISQQ